jgi:hypothetical protein
MLKVISALYGQGIQIMVVLVAKKGHFCKIKFQPYWTSDFQVMGISSGQKVGIFAVFGVKIETQLSDHL